ncbi:hypothetical protein FHL15_007539 [Xylaria flabelliformis]|uniref:Uncharacterized protein n=1 Tax=Xylaria flabelliformis TaxID=2512241 RepID=A0A553HUC4_9PEZI|nr:hypothetical protein FHL15_007539 [Xylaria flabelliformis]
MTMAMTVRLPHIRLVVARAHAIAVHPGQYGREEEEDGIQDPKGEARLEHGARLVDGDIDPVQGRAAEDAEADVHAGTPRHIRAVGVGDEPQRVDGADEGAYEEQINYRYEVRVRR